MAARWEVPTADSFAPDLAPPPDPNPELWKYLEDALFSVCWEVLDHDKVAWIKSEGVILGPEDINEACRRLAMPRPA